MTIRISVVVPTHKRHELLNKCLAALAAQDLAPSAYEVIVADDAASDDTRQLVDSRAREAKLTARYIPVIQSHGPAAARNCGWRAARGEIIAFTDDDCIPFPGWLSAGLAAFTDGVVGVAGRLIMPLPESPTDYERSAAALEEPDFVTANSFYRRDALATIGGFDERFTAAWREDSDLIFTLRAHNVGRFVHAPDAIVIHPIRPAPWGVSLGQQRKSQFNALLYKKHPSLYRQLIEPTPPWRYYTIVGALLMALGGGLGGYRWTALGAGGLWALLTGQFCVQRTRQTSHSLPHVVEMAVTSALIPPLSIFWRIRGALKFRVFFV